MSGPLGAKDLTAGADVAAAPRPPAQVSDSRVAEVGGVQVRRALPNRAKRTVGAWCFADHFGPLDVDRDGGLDIGPHPHLGLQTVTWLLEGELVHHDSLGSDQPVRPGQLNLMTAGHGVAHAEETPSRARGSAHGFQLWIAQPAATRDGAAAFEHVADLPEFSLPGVAGTVIVGHFAGVASPARSDTDHVGVDLRLPRGTAILPLDPAFEHALVAAEGSVAAEGRPIGPGKLLYLGEGWDELVLETASPARALLLGGEPFPEALFMWWNFVARTREEIDAAYDDWSGQRERFGDVVSSMVPIEAPVPLWRRPG